MKTIEDIYAEMFEAHENIMAARRQEHIRAANPYGCNQYGEGWKQPHNGKQTWRPGSKAKNDDSQKSTESQQSRLSERMKNMQAWRQQAGRKAPQDTMVVPNNEAQPFKPDEKGDIDLLILPNGDIKQATKADLRKNKGTEPSSFHINPNGAFSGYAEDMLLFNNTLDEALEHFPSLSESSKQRIRDFFKNRRSGGIRFHRIK